MFIVFIVINEELCMLFFYRYLIEQGCNLAAVNNDGELALDIAESDEMEDMLQQHINKAGLYLYMYICRMSMRPTA